MSRALRQHSDLYSALIADIYAFSEALHFSPTWQQRELFDGVMYAEAGIGPNRLAVKSGQGPGKTSAECIIGLWRALRGGVSGPGVPTDSLTLVTAPTMRQCIKVWLVECRGLIDNADPQVRHWFNVTKSKIEIMGRPDWGVQFATASKAENAQGLHRPNLTIIVDEASGVAREIITQYKGTLKNPNPLLLMGGNPNTRDCAFFDCFNNDRNKWGTLTWNAEQTAKDYPHIVTPQSNADMEAEFGRDSDVYRVRVLGEFPNQDPNCVMSSEDLEKVCGQSMDHVLACAGMLRDDGTAPAKQFGMDFARFGGDENTCFRRSGNAIVEWGKWAHTDPSDVINNAFRWQHEAAWRSDETWFVADAGGMGQGVMHKFHNAHRQVLEFHNGSSAIDANQYANKITEAWFQTARKVKTRRCALPRDNPLIQQLSTRQYYMNKKGQLILETKDEYLKRGFEHSPDRAEGAAYAMYDHVSSSGAIAIKKQAQKDLGVRMAR